MTVDQVIDTLKLEKQQRVPSRFPCRAIMVGNIAEYCDLLEKLKTIPNVEVVPSDVLFSSADVLPAYDSLMDSQYKDKWLILPGVSEYLRLFSRGETQRQRFTKLWRYMGYGSDLGRIIIPLWGCSAQWHDKDLHLDGDERQKDFFFDCSSNQVIAKDSDGNQYLIFKNYDHFKQSGFAAGGDDENAQYGELHGGASPEELLVPVVVFDSIHELPLTATWKKDSIKFSMKKAKPVILFNKPVQNVQASLGSVDGICTPIDTVGKEWMIVFSENKAEATKNFKYDPIIIADGKVVHVPSLEIKPALGGGDFDL